MNNNISKKYIWVSFFKELSNKLLQFNNNRKELTKLINDVLVNLGDDVPDFTFDINPTSNEKIKDIYLDDIDPFTVFSLMVNAGEKKRKKVAKEYANIFYIKSQIPENFDGVPSNKRCNKMFYSFSGQDISRLKSIDILWDLFEKILSLKNGDLSTICNEFDKVLKIKGIGVTMCTMALFWVAPERFISLDTPTKNYVYDSGMFPPRIISLLPEKRKIDFINAEDYISLIEIIKNYLISEDSKLKNFVELSAEAYKRAEMKKEFKKMDPITYLNKYSYDLIRSGNIIFHGAPGTGKTYLACNIAADIISDGKCLYADLSEELKKQIQFVQFHPSYDYTDFVEGLRPVLKDDDTMYFKLQPGIFKDFIGFARRNYELHVDTSEKTKEKLEKELYAMKLIDDYLSDIEINELNYSIQSGNKFAISEIDDEVIRVFVPDNSESNKVKVDKIELRNMIASGKKFEKAKDIKKYFKNKYNRQCDSYLLAIYKQIILSKKNNYSKEKPQIEELKKYVFIIDEINRGEISKIFGELFFSIDYKYRGKKGEVATQYSNMHDNPNEKFYIPPNVYIIGTMNDIDRSVDTFDFAMRRRFRFIELKYDYDENYEMLNNLNEFKKEAIDRMESLNKCIKETEDLNENYQIGPAYFQELDDLDYDFDILWRDYLQPLLREYIRGMDDEEIVMEKFEKAYKLEKSEDE